MEENFSELLEKSLTDFRFKEGQIVKGTVLFIKNDTVVVDVGLKSEGRIPLKEFHSPGEEHNIEVGDMLLVIFFINSFFIPPELSNIPTLPPSLASAITFQLPASSSFFMNFIQSESSIVIDSSLLPISLIWIFIDNLKRRLSIPYKSSIKIEFKLKLL